jgi:hypothetical protein
MLLRKRRQVTGLAGETKNRERQSIREEASDRERQEEGWSRNRVSRKRW